MLAPLTPPPIPNSDLISLGWDKALVLNSQRILTMWNQVGRLLRSTRPSVPPGLLPGLIACQGRGGRGMCWETLLLSLLPSSDSLLSHVEQLLRAFILEDQCV